MEGAAVVGVIPQRASRTETPATQGASPSARSDAHPSPHALRKCRLVSLHQFTNRWGCPARGPRSCVGIKPAGHATCSCV